MLVHFPVDRDLIATQIGFPCVVKLLMGSYGDGVAFDLNPWLEQLAAQAAAINLGIAGVDLLFDGSGYSVCEVNSAPGFAGFEAGTGSTWPAPSCSPSCRGRLAETRDVLQQRSVTNRLRAAQEPTLAYAPCLIPPCPPLMEAGTGDRVRNQP